MHARHLIAVLMATLATGGCEKKTTPGVPSAMTSAAEAPIPAQSAPELERRAPADVDLSKLQKQLKCSGGRAKKACGVLEAFAKAEQWTGDTPSGDGRWMGLMHRVTKGEETTEIIALRARRVPTAKVGPYELPLMVSTSPIPDHISPFAKKLVGKLGRGSKPNMRNPVFKFLRETEPTKEWGAIDTSGISVNLISDEPTYLRKEGRKQLYWVSPSAEAAASPGDGSYGKLWMVLW
jgi:hypothetical protein